MRNEYKAIIYNFWQVYSDNGNESVKDNFYSIWGIDSMVIKMKRVISLITCLLVLVMTFSGCGTVKDTNGNVIDKQTQQYIEKALSIINTEWKSTYIKNANAFQSDKTVEIINTRVINIKENDIEDFKDIVAVVEFDILSDYYGSSPYYSNIQQHDTVTFYKDGTTKTLDIFNRYRQKNYTTDYSGIIDNIIECGEAYNTDKIKVTQLTDDKLNLVEQALETLKSGWMQELTKYNEDNEQKSDGTLKICNTQLVIINQNSTDEKYERYFEDIEAIIEFEIYSDYYGSAPYYVNAGMNDTVIIRTDGTSELTSHYIRNVGNKTYDYDFTSIFSEIDNLGNQYNKTYNLFENGIKSLDDGFSEAVDNMK